VVRLHGGNRMVFTSGQVALDPRTGELEGADVAAQTERVIENLKAVLRGAGMTLADVVKTTVYLADMNDFTAMNEVYARHFPADFPARSTIAAAGLPKGARVEIDAVAVGRDL
jgi:2-iminobutanoate/2-iminopropanoate deaminase